MSLFDRLAEVRLMPSTQTKDSANPLIGKSSTYIDLVVKALLNDLVVVST